VSGAAWLDAAGLLLDGFNVLVVLYFVALNSVYLGMSVFAFRALRRYALRMKSVDVAELMATAGMPPVTLLAPAYNEEATCVEATRSLLTLRYPSYDILVVNDGSRDGTLARLTEAFDLQVAARAAVATITTAPVRAVLRSRRHPNLWVVDTHADREGLPRGLDHRRSRRGDPHRERLPRALRRR
jgi:hypothetical protein